MENIAASPKPISNDHIKGDNKLKEPIGFGEDVVGGTQSNDATESTPLLSKKTSDTTSSPQSSDTVIDIKDGNKHKFSNPFKRKNTTGDKKTEENNMKKDTSISSKQPKKATRNDEEESDSDDDDAMDKAQFNQNQNDANESAKKGMMDTALMMTNISQLRTIMNLGSDGSYHFWLMLSFILFSLVLQVIFSIMRFVLQMKETKFKKKMEMREKINQLQRKGMPQKAADHMRHKMLKPGEEIHDQLVLARLHNFTSFVIFLVTILNMFITGIGIKSSK